MAPLHARVRKLGWIQLLTEYCESASGKLIAREGISADTSDHPHDQRNEQNGAGDDDALVAHVSVGIKGYQNVNPN